jgi:TPR repeat protein
MFPESLTWSCDKVLQHRLLPGVWDEIQTSNSQKDQNARIALVLCAMSDHNNNILNPHQQFQILHELVRKGLVVHIKVIDKAKDVEDAIRDAGSSLETLYLIGHGFDTFADHDKTAIVLADDEYFTSSSIPLSVWKESSLKSILLESCSAAPLAQQIGRATGIPTSGASSKTYRGYSHIKYCPKHEHHELSVIDIYNGEQDATIFYGESSRAPCSLHPDYYPEQIAFLEEHIQKGLKDPSVYALLAARYVFGKGVQKNLPQAREYYRLAAEGGDPYAQTHYALYLSDGIGGPTSLDEAEKWHQKSVEKGNLVGQYNLGMFHWRKAKALQGAEKKEAEKLAAKYLKDSADQEYAPAEAQLAIFRLEVLVERLKKEEAEEKSQPQPNAEILQALNQGIKHQKTSAFELLDKACKEKDLGALNYVGNLHLTGSESSRYAQSDVEALKFFKEAEASGSKKPFYRLGLFHKRGNAELPRSIDKAMEYFAKDTAWPEGHSASAYELAILYLWKHKYEGSEGLFITGKEVLQKLEKVADKGYLPAKYLLGRFYSEGVEAYEISPSAKRAQEFFDFVKQKGKRPLEDYEEQLGKDLASLGLLQINGAAAPFFNDSALR